MRGGDRRACSVNFIKDISFVRKVRCSDIRHSFIVNIQLLEDKKHSKKLKFVA